MNLKTIFEKNKTDSENLPTSILNTRGKSEKENLLTSVGCVCGPKAGGKCCGGGGGGGPKYVVGDTGGLGYPQYNMGCG